MAALTDGSLIGAKCSFRYFNSLFPAKLTWGTDSVSKAAGGVCAESYEVESLHLVLLANYQ